MTTIIWYNLEHDGVVLNDHYTVDEAKKAADTFTERKHERLANGVEAFEDFYIVAIDEDYEEVSREKYQVELCGYHGDIIEHGTY